MMQRLAESRANSFPLDAANNLANALLFIDLFQQRNLLLDAIAGPLAALAGFLSGMYIASEQRTEKLR